MLRRIGYKFYRITGYTIIALAIMLCIMHTAIPLLAPSPGRLTSIIKQQFIYPTTMEEINLRVKGFSPYITLSQVKILTEQGHVAFNADAVEFSLNLPKLLFGQVCINKLTVQGAKTEISHLDHFVSIKGLPKYQIDLKEWDQAKQSVVVRKLILKDSKIDLFLDDTKKIAFENLQLLIVNKHGTKIRGSTIILNKVPTKVLFGANIKLKLPLHPTQTQFYVESDLVNLEEFSSFIPNLRFQSIKGELGVKCWVQLKDNQETSLKAQVKLNQLEIMQEPHLLKSHSMKGWIQAQKKGENWTLLGNEWEIYDTPVSSLSQVPLSFNLKHEKNDQEHGWELIAHDVDIQKWLKWTNHFSFLPVDIRNNIEVYQLKGHLEYLHLGIKERNTHWSPYIVESAFRELSTSKDSHWDLASLTGYLTFDGQRGSCQLISHKGKLEYPALFKSSLEFDNLSSVMHFQKIDSHFSVQGKIDSLTLNHIPLFGHFAFKLADDKKDPFVEMLIQTDGGKVSDVLGLLPRNIMDNTLTNWLDKAIINGEIQSSKCVLRGNLAHFPFDKQEGLFELGIKLEKVDLDYHEGWPALKSLTADLFFHNRTLTILGKEAELEGGKLLDAKATIPDLYAPIAQLILDTEIANSLEASVKVIEKSPLQSLSKNLSPLNLKGDMTLSLGLTIPLSTKSTEGIKVRGVVGVEDAFVKVKSIDLDIEHLKGAVSFTENSIKSDELEGKLLANLTKFQIDSEITEESNDLNIQANGHVKLEKLRRWLKLSPIKMISGETDYEASLKVSPGSTKPTELLVNSSLNGILINAPLPFLKTSQIPILSEFKFIFDATDHMNISVQYGPEISMSYALGLKNNSWETLGGHIHFGDKNTAQIRNDGVLLIDGEIKELNLQAWKDFFIQAENADSPKINGIKPQLDLKTQNFNAYGALFANTKISAVRGPEKPNWQVQFEGPALSGQIIFPGSGSKENIIVNLDQLILNKRDEFSYTLSNEKHATEQPIVELNIKKLTFNDKVFEKIIGRFEPSWKGYYCPNIRGKYKRTDISVSGQWDFLSPLSPVRIEGKLSTKNIQHTLRMLGIESNLHKAKGNIDFSLQWNGTPAVVDYPTLTGYAHFSLKQGYLYGVNPGMGRVLSLFNLDNVQRRLTLDFSDLTKDSLAFDMLTGKLRFGKGKISTNNLVLKGPAAKINAIGQADLENFNLNAEMTVMPNLTGSLPVAAAIAVGNPAVGAAVWVFDKVLGSKIQEIHQYRYKVVGSWSAPQIEEIPNLS